MTKDELAQQYFSRDYAQLRKSEKKVIDTQMEVYPNELPEDSARDLHPAHPDAR
jgi:hypothetical protein